MGTRETENEIPISPPWIELPGDVTANILRRLGAEEILKSAEKVCTTWRKVCLDPAMWRVVHMENPLTMTNVLNYELMCRCAVDRSQGQLIDLSIAYIGDVDLLNYVADRSSHLRRLTLAHAWEISAFALTEAVKKLPRLEELHLLTSFELGAEGVEAIGSSCPLLKSFTCDENENGSAYEIGLAIAKTMPNLRSLKLNIRVMCNEGLEAILDGCPRLESLDIYNCRGLDLKAGDLGERCSKQIKDLTLPNQRFFDFLNMVSSIPLISNAPNSIDSDGLMDALNSIDSDGEYDFELLD